MKILVAPVGKLKPKCLAEIAGDYVKRMGKYYPTEVKELKSADQIPALLKSGDLLISCDEAGTQMTSAEFASWLQKKLESTKRIVFAIGGAEGLGKTKNESHETISFSKMTLQHDLFHIVFLEQLYRAMTIIHGEKYHR